MTQAIVEEYWEIEKDGVWYNLHSYSQHVKSIYGARTGVPNLRGENVLVYGVRGATWNEKTPDQETISLAGWITALNPDGSKMAVGPLAGIEENWKVLRQLLWREDGSQYQVRRTWKGDDGSIKTATALAEYGGNLAMNDSYPMYATWAADILLADPFFYGDPITVSIAEGATVVVDNPGDASSYPEITFNGQLTSPQIDHDGKWMRLGASIAAGDSVVVKSDPRILQVTRQSDSANLIGSLTRSGSRAWLPLRPGTNSLTLTASAGTGTVDLTFQPAYL